MSATPIASEARIKKLLLLALIAAVPDARAFTLLLPAPGRPIVKGFTDGNVNVQLNPAGCPIDLEPIIKDALAVWNVVPASRLQLSYGGTTASQQPSRNLLIQCSSDVGENDTTIGIGGATYPNGPIDSGYVYMNASSGAANIANFQRGTVLTALAHEMGHALGFGHSQDPYAIMYFAVGQRDPILLAQDDVDAVNFLYGRDELGNEKMMGCAAVMGGSSAAGGGGRMLWTLFFLMLPFAALAGARKPARAKIKK